MADDSGKGPTEFDKFRPEGRVAFCRICRYTKMYEKERYPGVRITKALDSEGWEMAKKYYAVKNGRGGVSGVYLSWEDCRSQAEGVPGASYKSFRTLEEAETFLRGKESSLPQKDAAPPEPPPYREGIAVAYVDGSFLSDTKEFSCGAVLFYDGRQMEFSKKYNDPGMADMHNVAGEIMGAVSVIQYCLDQNVPALEIHHDYEGVAKWAQGVWKANKPGTQAYAAFCREARQRMKLAFIKVRGHSGDYWNDQADALARRALGI